MKVKLSALAIGITLAYGMSAAMAADASIEQIGNFNTAVIDQYSNNGSDVSASIATSGWSNDHSIDQTRSDRVWARIIAPGSGNTAGIEQSRLDYGGAQVYQAASLSSAHVDQGASGFQSGPRKGKGKGHHHSRDGSSQWAFVNQNGGWGHDADIVQRGDKVKATISQTGTLNVADVDQRGNGYSFNEATVDQGGTLQYANVKQNGSGLTATVTQRGLGNVALVDMSGHGHTAKVFQNGWGNIARVNQSN